MKLRLVVLAIALSLFTLASAVSYEILDGSEARYRVREQLANLSLPNDAVGVTTDVSGSIHFSEEGSVLPDSEIVVNLSTLKSDQNRRDNFLRNNTLQTSAFPTVLFVPTEIQGLSFPLPDSDSASFRILGELTIRNVTRPVVWQAEANFAGDTVTLEASTSFSFEDFDLTQPRVALVLSVENRIGLEVGLSLHRVAE